MGKITINSPQNGYTYNIVQENVDGILVTYYVHPLKSDDWGTEIYSGENYVVGSKQRSHSRNYKHWNGLPRKWLQIAMQLQLKHQEIFGGYPKTKQTQDKRILGKKFK
jgi:hypothetical protein